MAVSLDCLVIGGGPAGLTAAIYLARFRLKVCVVDAGQSRAALIPCTRNHAGFPGGISGIELLDRMRRQAREYGAELRDQRVVRLDKHAAGFSVFGDTAEISAKTVLIATGVTNLRPEIGEPLHRRALAEGRLRYCPVCDGYEVTDQKVAVIGTGARALKEALFLRAYTKDVSLVPNTGPHQFSKEERRQIVDAGIAIIEMPAVDFHLRAEGISFLAAGQRLVFEAIYPALGSDIHSGLAGEVGADRTEEGSIKVDAHQRTSVAYLYAAGDVVAGLDQISHAMGEAGVAATTIRNDIAAEHPLRR
jgi:thioredoxin reductase (NADPH)